MRQRPDIPTPHLGQDKAKEHDGVRVREASQETGQFAVVMDCFHCILLIIVVMHTLRLFLKNYIQPHCQKDAHSQNSTGNRSILS